MGKVSGYNYGLLVDKNMKWRQFTTKRYAEALIPWMQRMFHNWSSWNLEIVKDREGMEHPI